MITVAAGDNVVRLLPPLIVSEEEIAEAIARLDRACTRLDRAASAAGSDGWGTGKEEARG
jgi:acetylornithine/N-succinyldiaminopimelate aminotransferase